VGVPELGAEVAVALDAVHRDLEHAADGRHLGQREAQGIGAECVDDLDRVDDIAEVLDIFLPFSSRTSWWR
jgi:hypothetical protein